MPKEIKVYEADDKKTFKTKKGAENHNKRLAAAEVIKKMNMTENEIGEKLIEISERLPAIYGLLKHEPNWTKWIPHHIKQINEDIFKQPLKITKYVRAYKYWGKEKEEELFIEKGIDFADPELHCKDEYKVIKVEEINSINRKIYYDYKYEWNERMAKKLKAGEELSSSEIRELLECFDEIYEESGEDRRWSKSMLTVVDIAGDLYAIQWEKGLTENQENEYYNQPYPCTLETKEIVITETMVVRKEPEQIGKAVAPAFKIDK